MAFSSGDPLAWAKAFGETSKTALDVAGGNLQDSFKKRQDVDIETGKLMEVEKYKSDLETGKQNAFLKGIGMDPSAPSGQPGNKFKPTKFIMNGITFEDPSQNMTAEQQRSVAGVESVLPSIENMKRLISGGALRGKKGTPSFLKSIAVDSGVPQFAGTDVEPLQSELNNLKSMIPFAKGGKQLTHTELSLLSRLLDTTGKDESTIINDLDRFSVEFERIKQLASGEEPTPGFSGQSNQVDNSSHGKFKFMEDASGNKAKVYDDGFIEEIA